MSHTNMRLGVLALAAALVLGACGDGNASGEEAGGEDGEVRTVTVGMAPIATAGAIRAGMEQGFFEKHGIELKFETGTGGAALLPSVVAGHIQFATATPVSLLQARDQGLEVRAIAGWTSALEEGSNVNVVRALDPGITTAADLQGKRVAVNTLNGMGDLTIREAVRSNGGDPDAVEFVELPFPEMQAALEQRNIDAAWVPEPFGTLLEDAGAHVVTYPSDESVPGHPSQLFFTSTELAESDPDLVEAMAAAIRESAAFANESPEAVREGAAEVVDIDPGILKRIVLEQFNPEMPLERLTALGELMYSDKMIKNPPDIEGLIGR
ncbi:ABC transporter substrate-binding protein [Georgenia sp. SYP-B2076]|uniref:ABC transporter substrate-binding protein n=1 Tax=Georgenia sp. SYP-B2076 TaxID=2495881 RepID=UPI000F8D8697|nr:ABC transporter substrate-binding protein [Georgenia sp. SYP-B2076]